MPLKFVGNTGSIPGSAFGHLVEWIDYTGEVVASRRALTGAPIPSHPVAPTHDGLTFDAWYAQDPGPITRDTEIHAHYYATDGKAHLLVDADELAGLTPTIKVAKSDTSTTLIEWGDGTTSTVSGSGNVTVVKPEKYAAGSYDIKLSISSGTGTFTGGHGTSGNPLIAGVAVTEMRMRASSTTVTSYAFNGTAFRTMRYMTGLGGITSIGAYAFRSCYALVSVVTPLVTSVGINAFQSCYALASVVTPLVTSIGNGAFQSCQAIVSIIIGPACTLIDVLAFDGCRILRSLTVQATTPPTLASDATIADYDPRMLIYVPSASVAAYQAATNWSAFASRIVGY